MVLQCYRFLGTSGSVPELGQDMDCILPRNFRTATLSCELYELRRLYRINVLVDLLLITKWSRAMAPFTVCLNIFQNFYLRRSQIEKDSNFELLSQFHCRCNLAVRKQSVDCINSPTFFSCVVINRRRKKRRLEISRTYLEPKNKKETKTIWKVCE